MNLLHSIKARHDNTLINAIVEIPKGSQTKIEYDSSKEEFTVDRVLNNNFILPFNYGFIPETWSADNDPLDIVILSSNSIPTGTQIKSKIIGVLATTDQEGSDSKIIATLESETDKLISDIKSLDDLDKQSLKNIEYFYKNYKINEPGKWVDINGYYSRNQAEIILNEAIERYHQHFQK